MLSKAYPPIELTKARGHLSDREAVILHPMIDAGSAAAHRGSDVRNFGPVQLGQRLELGDVPPAPSASVRALATVLAIARNTSVNRQHANAAIERLEV